MGISVGGKGPSDATGDFSLEVTGKIVVQGVNRTLFYHVRWKSWSVCMPWRETDCLFAYQHTRQAPRLMGRLT